MAAPKMVNDLNLRPTGKMSLRDFVTEKAPKTQDDKNALVVYYLKSEIGLEKISADHVFTAYREMRNDWKLPSNLRNSLQVTKSTTGWIDTSDGRHQDHRLGHQPCGARSQAHAEDVTIDRADALAGVPATLRAELLRTFGEIVQHYRAGRWEPSELNGGKFCEVVYSVLKGHVDGKMPTGLRSRRT